jgi:hypothetical protein
MLTVFSDLLAPRESARRRLIRQEIQLHFFICADQSANKELEAVACMPLLCRDFEIGRKTMRHWNGKMLFF